MNECKPEWHSTKTEKPEDFSTIIVRIKDETDFIFGAVGYCTKPNVFLDHGKIREPYELTDFDDWAYINLLQGIGQ